MNVFLTGIDFFFFLKTIWEKKDSRMIGCLLKNPVEESSTTTSMYMHLQKQKKKKDSCGGGGRVE